MVEQSRLHTTGFQLLVSLRKIQLSTLALLLPFKTKTIFLNSVYLQKPVSACFHFVFRNY